MPTNEYGQPTDSKGNVKTQTELIMQEIDDLIYSDENDGTPWFKKHLAALVLKHRHDVYFQAFKDGVVAGRKEAQAMLDSSEEE